MVAVNPEGPVHAYVYVGPPPETVVVIDPEKGAAQLVLSTGVVDGEMLGVISFTVIGKDAVHPVDGSVTVTV